MMETQQHTLFPVEPYRPWGENAQIRKRYKLVEGSDVREHGKWAYEHIGPEYPELGATVAKLRKSNDRKAHGEAVEKAIRALQRSELMRAAPPLPKPNCASGTAYTTGEEIHEAILRQQRNALLAYPAKVRRERTSEQWRSAYEAAMMAKRKRETQAKKRKAA